MSIKLNPTEVTEATVGDVAFDGVRRRPVVAINDEGTLVVCCRRTAVKNGWKLEGTLHQRAASKANLKPGTAKTNKVKVDASVELTHAGRRATDPVVVMAPSVEDILK